MKKLIAAPAVLAVLGAAAPTATAGPQTKVVGGHVDVSPSVGWMAALSERGRYTCSGSLVAPRHVLTAAHCTRSTRARHWRVRLDSKDRTEGGVTRRVRRILQFPRYGRTQGDMALLRLRRPVRAIEPIGLVRRGTDWRGNHAYTAGWGQIVTTGRWTPRWLRSAWVPIQPDRVCRRTYGRQFFDGRFLICAGARRPAACRGDSGGPLARWMNGDWRLVGVTSLGKHRCNRPVGYAWVGSKPLRRWLRKRLGR